MHRKLLRLRADLRSCRAVKIDVRRKIFIAAAGVQVDYAVAVTYHGFLKECSKLFGVGSACAAGKNAIEVFSVGRKNVRAAADETIVIECMH